jgi:hypothetical protein
MTTTNNQSMQEIFHPGSAPVRNAKNLSVFAKKWALSAESPPFFTGLPPDPSGMRIAI